MPRARKPCQSLVNMEPFNAYKMVNASVLTQMPVNVLRNAGDNRLNEVKFCEDINFDGRALEQTYTIQQSDRAILRSLRRGAGSTTLRMRPVGDKVILYINRTLKVELSMPHTPRLLHLNDNNSILTEDQRRKRCHELLKLADDGGFTEPGLTPFPGCPPPLPPRPPAVEEVLAAAHAAQAAVRAEQQDAAQEITVLKEKLPIFIREPESLASRECTLESVGVIATVGEPEKASKKKKEENRPETRSSSVKKVNLRKHQREKRQQSFKEQVNDFQKVQDLVAKQAATPNPPDEREIPQITIRNIASVEQNLQSQIEAITQGDILDLKEEPLLIIDEC